MKKLIKFIYKLCLPLLVAVMGLLLGYYFIKSNGLENTGITRLARDYGPLVPESTITAEEIVKLTNDERSKLNLKPLSANDKLVESSMLKAQDMIDNNYWAHTSPTKVEPWFWIQRAGYSYIDSGENLAKDYYNSNAVIKAWMLSPEHKENIVNPRFKEIGVTVMKGKILGSETTLVVQHFGSQRSNTPPNYSKDTVLSWENTLSSLQNIKPNWENIRNSPNKYPNNKDKCDRIITIINTRINKIQQIIAQMKANKWLSTEQDKYTVSGDKALYNEQESLATYLNSQGW